MAQTKTLTQLEAERLIKAKQQSVAAIAKDETLTHKLGCAGFLAAQDVLAYLMQPEPREPFDLDKDYSGDGETVRDILGPDYCAALEARSNNK